MGLATQTNELLQYYHFLFISQKKNLRSLPFVSQSHYLCLQVMGGEAAPVGSGFLWWHWRIGYVSTLSEEDSWCSGPRLAVVLWRLLRLGSFLFAIEWIMSPQFQMAHLPTQWPITDQFPLTPRLSKVFERLVRVSLSWEVYGMQRCASNRLVRLMERSCTYNALLCVSHTLQSALKIGKEARMVICRQKSTYYI